MFLQGFALCLLAFTIWGLAPIFWKQATHIPTEILLYHRVIFANIILALWLIPHIRDVIRNMRQQWRRFIVTAVLIGTNWFTFVWAIINDKILETSLGYYLNPFLNLCVAAIFLNEKLKPMQYVAVGIAFMGVGVITYSVGYLPWVSVLLATSFCFYGYFHKKSSLRSEASLYIETTLLLPIFLALNFSHPQTLEVYKEPMNFVWLFFGGFITVLPLVFFIQGVKYIPFSLTGILQFLAPSMTFFIAIFKYEEPASRNQYLGFSLIWLAILIYVGESFRKRIKRGTLKA
tara:strand:- start:5567 stop:6433 length:867 start_codon:yes stop_codon:yes gene_type:complete